MTTETKPLTQEQRKQLDKLGFKFFLGSIFSGVYHATLLVLINFVTTLAVLLMEGPEWMMMACAVVAGIIIFRRMLSITKESHDRLILEAKKIVEPK